jgi:hypothetical protein
MPFQRLYVVHTPYLINVIQSKANVSNFIPNLLDFGMLFSGLDKDAKTTLRRAVGLSGNNFTLSVHKYMLSGPWLKFVTSLAVDKLGSSLPNTLQESTCGGLLESIRHELTLAMTGAVYGPGNPFDDRQVESSWWYVLLRAVRIVFRSSLRFIAISFRASIICFTARFQT